MHVYAWLLLISFAGPFFLSFDKKVAFYELWPGLFAGIFVNAFLFISWDYWFTKLHVWSFNPDYVFDTRLLGMPLEEWAFFIVIPYAGVFIYACLKTYFPGDSFKPFTGFLNYLFIILCLLAIIFFNSRLYTVVNCSLAFILLFVQQYWIKGKYMGYFWMSYFVQLIPFLIVNGILTGAFTANPIVIYNEGEITGWRIKTIPVEDLIYALTCLLLPLSIMELWVKRRKTE